MHRGNPLEAASSAPSKSEGGCRSGLVLCARCCVALVMASAFWFAAPQAARASASAHHCACGEACQGASCCCGEQVVETSARRQTSARGNDTMATDPSPLGDTSPCRWRSRPCGRLPHAPARDASSGWGETATLPLWGKLFIDRPWEHLGTEAGLLGDAAVGLRVERPPRGL